MNRIHVVVTFEVKPQSSSEFTALLEAVQRDLPRVRGCLGVRVFASLEDPCVWTLLEDWDSVEAHQVHIDHLIASGAWDQVVTHLAKPPVSHHCVELASGA